MKLKLTPKQAQALKLLNNPAKSRFLFDGGARSGKTLAILLWQCLQALQYMGSRHLVARKHRVHIHATAFQTLKELLPNHPSIKINMSDLIVEFHNGSALHFDGLDNADRIDKVLGSEWSSIFINEATQITYDAMTTLVTRLSQRCYDSKGRENKRALLLDCNPKSEQHWLHKLCIRHVNPNNDLPIIDAYSWGRLHWTPYDNPHLPPDFVASLAALPDVKRKRMLEGRWCSNEGSVYEEFDEDTHCLEHMPLGWEKWPRYVGIDFGYNNPFVWCEYVLSPDDVLIMYYEYYKTKRTVQEHYKLVLKDRFQALIQTSLLGDVISDHDAEDRAQLHDLGILTTRAFKDIRPGTDAVKDRLRLSGNGKPRLMFLKPACPHTIAEIYEYKIADAKPEKNIDEKPVKYMDHSMDQLRYVVFAMDAQTQTTLMSDSYAR